MSDKHNQINIDEILKDENAKKQLVDLLLDTSDNDSEITIKGKSYKVKLEVNFTSI